MKLVSQLAIGATVLAIGGVGAATVTGTHGPATADATPAAVAPAPSDGGQRGDDD